jgi:hypothetical protein
MDEGVLRRMHSILPGVASAYVIQMLVESESLPWIVSKVRKTKIK